MSTGIAIPAENAPAYEQYEAAERQAQQHEAQNIEWMERGYHVLGYVQAPRKENGMLVGFVWLKSARPEDTAGLPPAIVEKAKQAIAAEQAARTAFEAQTARATADIARMGLTGAGAEYHMQITRGESWAVWQATQKPTRLALRDLGQVAARAAELRQTTASGPQRIAAIEQHAAHQIALIRNEIDAATLEMMQLGIS